MMSRHVFRFLIAAVCLLALGIRLSASRALGSPDLKPSADHPVGWRGDGTGRFPGADPPVTWGRTVKGFYAGLRCLGGKPPGPQQAGELLNMGFVRDWAIVGPFDTADLKTGIDQDILKDETTLQPGIGESAGDKAWTHWHVSVENQSKSDGKLLLDLAQAYGKTEQQEWQNHPGTMQPWAAYAQSSIWSPVAGKVRAPHRGERAPARPGSMASPSPCLPSGPPRRWSICGRDGTTWSSNASPPLAAGTSPPTSPPPALRIRDEEHPVDDADARAELVLAHHRRRPHLRQCRRRDAAVHEQGRRQGAVDAQHDLLPRGRF